MYKTLKQTVLILLLLLLATGCGSRNGGGSSKEKEPVPFPETAWLEPEEMPEHILRDEVDLQREGRYALQLEDVLYLIAARGEQPSSGYEIAFVNYRDPQNHTLDVYLETVSPKPGEMVSDVLTYPAAAVRLYPQLPVFKVRFFVDGLETETVSVKKISAPMEETEVTLYFGTQDAYLKKEPRPVPISFATATTEARAGVLMNELLKGTMALDDTVNVIPAGTEAKQILFEPASRHITVTLSDAFAGAEGSAGEMLAVYSIVNTLVQLDGVDTVTLVIENGELYHMDQLENMTYNDQLISNP
jgi:hypothetical protein